MKSEPWTPCWKLVIGLDHSVSITFFVRKDFSKPTARVARSQKSDNIAFRSAINPKENLSVSSVMCHNK